MQWLCERLASAAWLLHWHRLLLWNGLLLRLLRLERLRLRLLLRLARLRRLENRLCISLCH